MVILAEGVNPFLAEKAGLSQGVKPESLALAVKEVLALPREKARGPLQPGGGHRRRL